MVLLAGLGGAVSGCASFGVGQLSDQADNRTTGSIAKTSALQFAGSDHSDWDLIRATVAASLSAPATAHIEWTNTASGDSGTITGLTATGKDQGRDCRSFASTISSIDGVHLYHAEVCRGVMKTWEFSKIAAADTQ